VVQFIDLSVTIMPDTPVYPGDPPVRVNQVGVLEKNGFCDHMVELGTHAGTHIDAPMHMLVGGKSLDQFPTEQFVGRGVVIDVSQGFELNAVRHADVQPGDIVLFYTGMAAKFHEPIYFKTYPAMSEEIAAYLVEKKVKMVGVDTCSMDNGGDSTEMFPIHKILLAAEVLLIENLTNLDRLIGKGCTVYALPLKLAVDGAPARVIAQVA
jgi:kynurenine formamidase